MVLLIVLSLFGGILPNLIYQSRHGPNREIVRYASEAERFGLRLTQLLLPSPNHRLAPIAELTRQYNRCLGEFCNENETVSLGIVISVGFVGVVGMVLFGRRSPRSTVQPLHAVGVLALAAFLIGTVSGGGALFNLIFPYIRCYNRIAVFIAFLSLFAMALSLEQRQRCAARPGFAAGFSVALVVLTAIGILDQTPCPADRARRQEQFESDAQFVRAVEDHVPAGAMIYQMPYVAFPESTRVGQIIDYDLLRPYLHSHRLRWSYGAMKGRPADAWHRHLAHEPLPECLEDLVRAGFAGITIDRAGYADRAATLEAELRVSLRLEPIVSSCERFAFFELGRSCIEGR